MTIKPLFTLPPILCFMRGTKHIEVVCYLVRERVEKGIIATPFVSTRPRSLICSPNRCANDGWSCCVTSWDKDWVSLILQLEGEC